MADLVSLLLHLECKAIPRQGLLSGLLHHYDRVHRCGGGDESLSDNKGCGQYSEDENAGFRGPVGTGVL